MPTIFASIRTHFADFLGMCHLLQDYDPACAAFLDFYDQPPEDSYLSQLACNKQQRFAAAHGLFWRNGIFSLLVGFTQLMES